MFLLCAHWIIILIILEITTSWLKGVSLFIICYCCMVALLVALDLLKKKYERLIQ